MKRQFENESKILTISLWHGAGIKDTQNPISDQLPTKPWEKQENTIRQNKCLPVTFETWQPRKTNTILRVTVDPGSYSFCLRYVTLINLLSSVISYMKIQAKWQDYRSDIFNYKQTHDEICKRLEITSALLRWILNLITFV